MLEAAGFKVTVGGNIGKPLSAQVEASTPETLHVVETSSFQLEQIDRFHPWIAVMLNLSPDHLDRHPDLASHAARPRREFSKTRGRRRVGGRQRRRSVRPRPCARHGRATTLRRFARRAPIVEGTAVEDGWIVDRRPASTARLVPLDAIHLIGPHLIADVMAAATVGAIAGAAPARP